MKGQRSLCILSIAALFATQSCKETVNDLNFDQGYASSTFQADTTSLVGVQDFGTYSTDPGIQAKLQADGFTLNNLKSITVKKAVISTVNGGQNLNYFRNLQIRMSNASGVDEVVIASVQLPDETTQTEVELNTSGVELKDIFKDSSVGFSIVGENDLPILPNPVGLKLNVNFDVKAALGN